MSSQFTTTTGQYTTPITSNPYTALGNNKFWNTRGNNYKINSSDYSGKYNDAMSSLFSGIGSSGTGTYDVGNIGTGTYDVGNVGTGTYDKIGSFNVGDSGKGTYTSDQLSTLSGILKGNLTNPLDSRAYNTTMDRLTGQELASKQSLSDSLAGWGRGSGHMAAQEQSLASSLGKERANTARTSAYETDKQNITNSMNLENLLSGIYESGKQRDLSNSTLGQTAFENAQQRGQSAYEAGQNRDITNAGMKSSAYESGRSGALSNATLGQTAYENAQNRALSNSNNRLTASTSALSGLADLLKSQGTNDLSAQNQTYSNLTGLSDAQESANSTNYTNYMSYLKSLKNSNPTLYTQLMKNYNKTGQMATSYNGKTA